MPDVLAPTTLKRVFISYQHVNPDMELARNLANYLSANDISIIFDEQIGVGERWFDWIDRHVRESDFLMVLISATSIRSDMVREEIKIAHEWAEKNNGFPKILPIRVDYQGDLPYDLGAYLNPLQYLLWEPGKPVEAITDKLIQSILRNDDTHLEKPAAPGSKLGQTEFYQRTQIFGAPLPSADYLLETGAMKQNSPFYVKRISDELLFKHGEGKGVTMVIKGPRQVGKSSLLARFSAEVKSRGASCFMLDFQMIDEDRCTDLNTLLKFIAKRIQKTFRTQVKVDDIWDDEEGPKMNIIDYLQEALLEEGDNQIYFLFDEVDRVFPYPFRNDFFSTLRSWHNERAHTDCWNRLNLILVHSTEPHLWITDEFQSPFNVGFSIHMDDFTVEQIGQLNRGYGSPLPETELESFLYFTGGHPFLVRQGLFSMVQSKIDFRQLTSMATSPQGPFGDHLKRYLWCLQQNKTLLVAFKEVVRHNRCSDELHFYKLRSAGLIRGESRDTAEARCRLYQQFFSRHL